MLVGFLMDLWFRSFSAKCLVVLHCMFVPQVILVEHSVLLLTP